MPKYPIIMGASAIAAASVVAYAQNGAVIDLPKVEIEKGRMEIIDPTVNPGGANIASAKSDNDSVATATPYRRSVQIVGQTPGKTTVKFFDSASRNTYSIPVWVVDSGKLSSGGYDATKVQLPQVILQPGRTANIFVPGSGRHQISRVVSSNTAITARTNTANSIQVWAAAQGGNAFVEFTDVATGTTYQVHVWIVPAPNTASGGGPGGGSGGGQGPIVKDPIINGPIIKTNGFDSCLIGNWRSAPIVNKTNPGIGGGDGVILTFKANGVIMVDYDGMQPVRGPRGPKDVNFFSGKASGTIAASGGTAQLANATSSTVIWRIDDISTPGGWGFFVPGTKMTKNSYSCTPTMLRFASDKVEYRYTRQGNPQKGNTPQGNIK